MRRWVTPNRSCPFCRCALEESDLFSIRLDFQELYRQMKTTLMHDDGDTCAVHTGTVLRYYCLTCKCLICPDCIAVGDHKGHSVEKLDKHIQIHTSTIQEALGRLGSSVITLNSVLDLSRARLNRRLEHQKQLELEAQRTYRNVIDNLAHRVDSTVKQLQDQQSHIRCEIELCGVVNKEVTAYLSTASLADIMRTSTVISQAVDDVANRCKHIQLSGDDDASVDVPIEMLDMVPPMESATLVILDYPRKRLEHSVVDSDVFVMSGTCWRCRAYCNNSGYLSVFVEYVPHVLECSTNPRMYRYQVQLLSAPGDAENKCQPVHTRQYQSIFVPGDSWGFHKFLDSDSIGLQTVYLRFSIQCVRYSDYVSDMKHYVSLLEAALHSNYKRSESEAQEVSVKSVDDTYVKQPEQKHDVSQTVPSSLPDDGASILPTSVPPAATTDDVMAATTQPTTTGPVVVPPPSPPMPINDVITSLSKVLGRNIVLFDEHVPVASPRHDTRVHHDYGIMTEDDDDDDDGDDDDDDVFPVVNVVNATPHDDGDDDDAIINNFRSSININQSESGSPGDGFRSRADIDRLLDMFSRHVGIS